MSPCISHWTSTVMSSTAPVTMASSCWRKLPAHGYAVAHEHLVGGAAHAREVDALGAHLLRRLLDLGVLGRRDEKLRKKRLVAVDDDVHLVFLEDAQVKGAEHGHGRAEHDVLKVRRYHGAAPAVREGAAGRLEHEVLVVLVDSHVGAVHDLDDFAVYAPGDDAVFAPDLLSFQRRLLDVGELPLLLPELVRGPFRRCRGDVLDGPALRGHAEVEGHLEELRLVLDGEALGLALGCLDESLHHFPGMVRVGGRACGDLAGEVPGHDRIDGRSAHTHPLLLFPFFDRGILQGPMAHILQQLSSTPMGQGFMSSARKKAVLMFSFSALSRSSSLQDRHSLSFRPT